MTFHLIIDIGPITHRIDLPPFIRHEDDARRFVFDLAQTGSVEPLYLHPCFLALVHHDGRMRAVGIPAGSFDEANEILDMVGSLGQLCYVA
jgi:hypothetical protein